MRKEIEEFAEVITPETRITELIGVVKSMEEISFLLDAIKLKAIETQPKKVIFLSEQVKARALAELIDLPKEELTIPKIQIKMQIGYPQASVIFDWLHSLDRSWGKDENPK